MAEASSFVGDCGTKLSSGMQAVLLKKSEVQVVVAIEIGTTFSGFAWSFSSTQFDISVMRATAPGRSEGSTVPTKVPTTVLLNPDQAFHSFGHEAVANYQHLDEEEQNNWYYFERFKMKLHMEEVNFSYKRISRLFQFLLQKLSRKTVVRAANGQELPIRTVFAHALRHFKRIAIKQCQNNADVALDDSVFRWVITVPAMWKVGAKQMMREAAYEAYNSNKSMAYTLLVCVY